MTSMAFKGQVYTQRERATTIFGSTRDRNVNKFNNTVYIFFIIHNNVSHIICSIILYTAVFFKSYINVYLILESVIFNVTEYVLSKNEDFWSIFFFCCVSKKKNKIKTRLKICNTNNKNFKLRNIFSDSLLYKTFLLAHSGFIMC